MEHTPDEQDEFYDALFNAAVDPALWPEALEAWRRATSGSGGNMYLYDWAQNASYQSDFVGYSDDVQAILTPELRDVDPWLAAAHSDPMLMQRMQRSTSIFVGHQNVAPGDYARSRYYDEVGRRCDITDTLTILSGNGSWTLGLITNAGHGHSEFDGAAILAAQRTLPWLKRALKIQTDIAERAIAEPFAAQWQESTVAAVALRAGRVVYANGAAEAQMARGMVMRSALGRFSLADSVAQEMLVHTLSLGLAAPRHRAATVIDLSGARWLIHLIRLRLPRGNVRALVGAEDPILLCLATPISGLSSGRREAIDGLARLTPSERDVLAHLMSGLDVASTAAATGRALETVRTMIKSMRAKVGAASIEDLLRLASLLMPF